MYQLEHHVRRLTKTSRLMIEDGSGEGAEGGEAGGGGGGGGGGEADMIDPAVLEAVTDEESVRDRTLRSLRATVGEFRRRYGDKMGTADELRITMLQTWLPGGGGDEGRGESLYCHVGLLPERRKDVLVRIEVRGHGRKNAAAKDSRWIVEREEEGGAASGGGPVEERILLDARGGMLEGTQTNFFLVTGDGVVVTAGSGILEGSVRESVLRVCEAAGIPLALRPPTVADLKEATGVFLTSTSRLVLPVHEVVVDVTADDVGGAFSFRGCQLTKAIQELVLEDVKTHCVPIY